MTPDEHIAAALRALGFDGDPEMAETAAKFTAVLEQFRPGPVPALGALPHRSTSRVALTDLPFHSLCAHHLLPFFGTCDLAFQPDGRIAGFGAFGRLLDALARRPQIQERLAEQLADAIFDQLRPRGVVVRLRARQMCVEMRGARQPGTYEVMAVRGEDATSLIAALGR